ncbi:apelin receptor early endogenous ligand [Festucalex cinctus]
MRIFNLLYLLTLLLMLFASVVVVVEPASIARPKLHVWALRIVFFTIGFNYTLSCTATDFLTVRKKYHRHFCLHRRCLPLHSRVPFP